MAWLLRQSVVHHEEKGIHGSPTIKFFSYISRPIEAMALCLELNCHFQGSEIFGLSSSKVWERLEWNEGSFYRFFFRAS